MSAFRELTLMRLRTFVREPEALFWTFVFPILMAIGLGLAFRERPEEPAVVAVERGTRAEAYAAALRASPEIRLRELDAAAAARALRKGDVGLVLAGRDSLVFRYDPARPESRLARLVTERAVQRAAGEPPPLAVADSASASRAPATSTGSSPASSAST